MNRKKVFIIILITILIGLFFGRRILYYTLFTLNGVKVNSISVCHDPYWCPNIDVKKNNKTYNLIIDNIKLSHFYSNGNFVIRQINGYHTINFHCDSIDEQRINTKTKKNVSSRGSGYGFRLGHPTGSMSNYFGYYYDNVFDYLEVIDSIYIKLMAIPDDRFIYWKNKNGDELYTRRYHVDSTAAIENFKTEDFEFKNCH